MSNWHPVLTADADLNASYPCLDEIGADASRGAIDRLYISETEGDAMGGACTREVHIVLGARFPQRTD